MVIFNEVKYRRYPESPTPHCRNYFHPGIADRMKGADTLHRDVWKFHNGEVPKGKEIHHIDGNSLNNNISNLTAITRREHLRLHPKNREKVLRAIKIAVAAANVWKKTPAGKKMVAIISKKLVRGTLAHMRAYEGITKTCRKCGVDFIDFSMPRSAKRCFDCRPASVRAQRKIQRNTAPVNPS